MVPSHIHIVDLNGAKDGKLVNEEAIRSIRDAVSCELDLGGGIRNSDSAKKLFDLGIDKLVLGSLLIKDRAAAIDIIRTFPDKIIAGIDAKNEYVAIQGWLETSEISVKSLLEDLKELPLASVIYTDISRDGMLTGPNIEELRRVASYTDFPIIASGGVSNINDITELKQYLNDGIKAVIVGKAILAGKINLQDLFK